MVDVIVYEDGGKTWKGKLTGWVALVETYHTRAGQEIISVPYAMVADPTGPIFKIRYDRVEVEL